MIVDVQMQTMIMFVIVDALMSIVTLSVMTLIPASIEMVTAFVKLLDKLVIQITVLTQEAICCVKVQQDVMQMLMTIINVTLQLMCLMDLTNLTTAHLLTEHAFVIILKGMLTVIYFVITKILALMLILILSVKGRAKLLLTTVWM